jgi:hypothetical protein
VRILGRSLYKLKIEIGNVPIMGVKKLDYTEFLKVCAVDQEMNRLEELEIKHSEEHNSFINLYNLMLCLVAACPRVKKLSLDFKIAANKD